MTLFAAGFDVFRRKNGLLPLLGGVANLFDGRGGALSAMASGAAELWLKWFLAGAMASSTNRIKPAELVGAKKVMARTMLFGLLHIGYYIATAPDLSEASA